MAYRAGYNVRTAINQEPTCFNAKEREALTNYILEMNRQGRSITTIQTTANKLRRLAKLTDLLNPQEALLKLSKLKWKNSTKRLMASQLNGFYQFMKIQFNKPNYTVEERLPFIPTEQEIDALINASPARLSALLQMLKETGMRIGEALSLEWSDLDEQRKTINITPEKGSNPRILAITPKLIGMCLNLKRFKKQTNRIFCVSWKNISTTYRNTRATTAQKLSNPRLNRITFHTLRHWKGTMEYHATKDIIHVKQILGHKCIDSTMVYINIEQAIFVNMPDEYTSRTAKTIEEATKLIDAGFEYVTEMDSIKIFRKRK